MRIILASASPRRHQLLHKVVDNFDIIPSTSDEQSSITNPHDLVEKLAFDKALEVFVNHRDGLVIGCDTLVECDGIVYGKPKDNAEAVRMIATFAGRTHNVLTGVCVMSSDSDVQFVECTEVTFKQLSTSDIEHYVANNNCLDKAGGYGIQDGILVSSINGSYDNVMGLPTETLAKVISNWQDTGEE